MRYRLCCYNKNNKYNEEEFMDKFSTHVLEEAIKFLNEKYPDMVYWVKEINIPDAEAKEEIQNDC